MPSKKSHARAAGKRAFSIALPEELIEEIQGIARDQDRSRNGQIEHFLKNSVAEWKREHAKPKIKALEDPAHVSPRKKIK